MEAEEEEEVEAEEEVEEAEDEEVEEAEEEHSSHFSIKGNAKKIRGKLRSTF